MATANINKLVATCSALIELSSFMMFSSDEITHNTQLLEGEWDHRLNRFVEEQDTLIKSPFAIPITKALLTKAYQGHLDKATVTKYTRVLKSTAPSKRTLASTPAVKKASVQINALNVKRKTP
jgi:hypothetical protein